MKSSIILLLESDVFGSFCGNTDVLAPVRRYPDRLVGGIYIDPRENNRKKCSKANGIGVIIQ